MADESVTYYVHSTELGIVHALEVGKEVGLLRWRRGTGDNVEILDLKVSESARDRGVGTTLLKKLLEALVAQPPYATVFGFTRVCNTKAQDFYRRMGFTLSLVSGVYDDGNAVVFSARYDELVKKHLE